MATFYHRVPILRPELDKIGGGFKLGTHYGKCCVLDLLSSLRAPESRTVIYPPDKATGIPVAFGGELPDPIPADAPRPAGYPITLTAYNQPAITGASASLELDGQKVDCWFSCPKSGNCCDDSKSKDRCNCGVDAHNARIDAALSMSPTSPQP